MKFTNRQFGDLDFGEEYIVEIPDGLIGFERCKRFVIVDDEDSEPFRWLVSVEDQNLSFPLLDASFLFPQYRESVLDRTDTTVFVVASLTDPAEKSTVNLRSPIIIDDQTRVGRQVILDDETLPFQHPLFPPPASSASE